LLLESAMERLAHAAAIAADYVEFDPDAQRMQRAVSKEYVPFVGEVTADAPHTDA